MPGKTRGTLMVNIAAIRSDVTMIRKRIMRLEYELAAQRARLEERRHKLAEQEYTLEHWHDR